MAVILPSVQTRHASQTPVQNANAYHDVVKEAEVGRLSAVIYDEPDGGYRIVFAGINSDGELVEIVFSGPIAGIEAALWAVENCQDADYSHRHFRRRNYEVVSGDFKWQLRRDGCEWSMSDETLCKLVACAIRDEVSHGWIYITLDQSTRRALRVGMLKVLKDDGSVDVGAAMKTSFALGQEAYGTGMRTDKTPYLVNSMDGRMHVEIIGLITGVHITTQSFSQHSFSREIEHIADSGTALVDEGISNTDERDVYMRRWPNRYNAPYVIDPLVSRLAHYMGAVERFGGQLKEATTYVKLRHTQGAVKSMPEIFEQRHEYPDIDMGEYLTGYQNAVKQLVTAAAYAQRRFALAGGVTLHYITSDHLVGRVLRDSKERADNNSLPNYKPAFMSSRAWDYARHLRNRPGSDNDSLINRDGLLTIIKRRPLWEDITVDQWYEQARTFFDVPDDMEIYYLNTTEQPNYTRLINSIRAIGGERLTRTGDTVPRGHGSASFVQLPKDWRERRISADEKEASETRYRTAIHMVKEAVNALNGDRPLPSERVEIWREATGRSAPQLDTILPRVQPTIPSRIQIGRYEPTEAEDRPNNSLEAIEF